MKTKLLSLTTLILFSTLAFAQPAGPNNPSQAMSVPVVNGRPWTNPANVFTANSTNAMAAPLNTMPNCAGANCFYTAGLVTANYMFAIPGVATVDGIMVEVMRMSINGSVYDSTVKVLKAGMPVGQNKASLIAWGNTLGYTVYGGAADLWGTTWTPADINNTNFGTYLTAYNQSTVQQPGAMIDHIRITIYYTMPVGIQESVSSDDMVSAYQLSPTQLQVNYNLGNTSNGKIAVTNILGQNVFVKNISASSGAEKIDISGLPS